MSDSVAALTTASERRSPVWKPISRSRSCSDDCATSACEITEEDSTGARSRSSAAWLPCPSAGTDHGWNLRASLTELTVSPGSGRPRSRRRGRRRRPSRFRGAESPDLEPDPTARCDAEREDLGDRPSGSSPATETTGRARRSRPSARVRHRVKPRQRSVARAIGLEVEEVECRARGAPGDGVDGSPERRHPRDARVGSGRERPTSVSCFRSERKRVPREPLGTDRDAASNDDLAAGDAGAGGSARERHRRKCPPGALLQDEHGVAVESRRPCSRPARTGARPHPPPSRGERRPADPAAVASCSEPGEYASHTRGRATIEREAAEHDDLAADRCCGRPRCAGSGIGARVSQALDAARPSGTSTNASTTQTRRVTALAGYVQVGSTSRVRPRTARTTTLVPASQPPAHRARQSSPPTFTCPSGQRLADRDARLADEHIDADGRRAPLRPPQEERPSRRCRAVAPIAIATSPQGDGRTKIASRDPDEEEHSPWRGTPRAGGKRLGLG